MVKNVFFAAFMICASFCSSGCVALLAGAAGGVGTGVWLSGKLTQEVNGSFDSSVNAAKAGLNDLSLPISKQTIEEKSAQYIASYTDGRMVWVDVHRVSDTVSRVEVRVGAAGDKVAARKIMQSIVARI